MQEYNTLPSTQDLLKKVYKKVRLKKPKGLRLFKQAAKKVKFK
jgi:hypothetical protein